MEEGRARGIIRIGNIPPQMLLEIFSRLPIRSLCRIRCVCKQWYHLTRDPFLHRMHLARAITIEDEPLFLIGGFYRHEEVLRTYVGLMTNYHTPHKALIHFPRDFRVKHSFDGLLCSVLNNRYLGLDPMPTLVVSNPLTSEHLTLPPFTAKCCRPWLSMFGLGFDPSIKKYKIVCGYFRDIDRPNRPCSLAQVYTMGISSSSSWREIRSQPTVPMNTRGKCVYAGGARHWMVNYMYNPDDMDTLVISFDFEKEEFKTLPSQGHLSASNANHFSLVDLRGHLGIVDVSSGEYIQIWKLKDYERNQWVREHRIPTCGVIGLDVQVVGMTTEDEIFLLKTFLWDETLRDEDIHEENEFVRLLAYNFKTGAWRIIHEFPDSLDVYSLFGRGLISHGDSLISPSA